MPTFIKTGFWEKLSKAPKEYLNLNLLIESLTPPPPVSTYKVYTALLTQTGTNAPVATVLENTLGFDVVWYYDNAGFYTIQNDTTGILFDPTKTWINTTADHTYDNVSTPGIYRGTESPVPYIGIITTAGSLQVDGALTDYSIEIRVYN